MKYLFLLLFLVGCSSYTEMEHCFVSNYDPDRKCSVIAKFEKSELCHRYKIIYQSAINYEELEKTGTTIARYYTHSNFGHSDLSCK